MKKILFLIHDLREGGAEKVLVNLVNNMDSSEFDITVMTLFDEGVNKQFLKPHIHYKSCFKKAIRGNSHLMKLLSPQKLYNCLIKDDYDIVISYLEGPCARIVGGAPEGVKVVSWIHSTVHNEIELKYSFRNLNEANCCYNRADIMAFVSREVQNAFLKVCNTKNNKIIYNTNETDLIIEKSNDHFSHNLFTDNTFHWCGIGKLTTNKGFDRMIRIQKRLSSENINSHLHILGIGPEEDSLKELCSQLDIDNSVTFWGYQTNPYKFLKKCDLFVCASHSEGFSTAATESLIVGTPVCTVEVSGMKEMLGENNEYGIVTDNNEEALYEAIKKICSDCSLLQHYKKMSELRGKDFSTETTVASVENMLLNL